MVHVTLVEWYGLGALLFVCLLAGWRGGAPERRVAAVIAACWIASVVVDNDGSRGVQWAIFGIDVFLAAWLTTEAIVAPRLWALATAAAQILIVLTHIGFALMPAMMQEGFFSAYYIWSYVVLAALAAGCVWRSHRDAAESRKSTS